MNPPMQVLIWKAAAQLFATPADRVVEVLPPVLAEKLLVSPEFLRGVIIHRGTRLPLLDATRLVGLPAEADRMCNRVLVLRTPSGAVAVWASAVLDLLASDAAGAQVETPWGHAERADPELLIGADRLATLAALVRGTAA
jgi:chemotaxis signal transduction protein